MIKIVLKIILSIENLNSLNIKNIYIKYKTL